MPGLVEGHSHVAEGVQWRFVYCGYFDRTDPGGKVWPGVKSIEEVVARLRVANAKLYDSKQPLTGWSLDPIYFDNRRMTRQDLDRVSTARPIGIMHASGHIMNVNTRALELAGLLRKGVNHPGIPLGDDGLPTGEIKGPDAMTPLGPHVGLDRGLLASDEPGLRAFARLCVRKGVTTAADLANLLPQPAVEMMLRVTGEDEFPARIVSLRVAREVSPAELVDRVVELGKLSYGPAAARHDQDRGRRLDPGIFGAAEIARILQRRARTACGTSRRSSCARSLSARSPPASGFTATPMATRRPNWCSTR